MEKINNLKSLKTRRKLLRKGGSLVEAIVWNHLKHRKLAGKKFRRQHSVGLFILDFYCPEGRLGVELDGATHDNPESSAYDKRRSEYLSKLGIKILRFQNKEVLKNLEGVLEEIKRCL